ncbi:MAG: SDR family oxidoreductase, partial [Novosphingobium sp.]
MTGAATGIGRATAIAFAREGASVMIGDIDDRADETVAMIIGEGGRAAFRKTDVRKASELDELVAQCLDRFGRMDAAFNTAGVLPPQRPIHEVTEEE